MKFEPERLDIVIRKLGKGQQKLFAKLLNVTPSAISRWKAEKEIPEKYCSVLELLGVNINWLETGEGEPFFEPSNVKPIDIDIESVIKKATRLVGIKRVLVPANAGRGYNFDTIEEEVVMYDPFDWLLNSKEWLMFTISGDSMIPMICPDATVY
ncbi:MAG: hypothetical protein N2517_09400, partial [Ignavibacteria bacterium]|nr:hypothetical protein [Ignavibacteria bacterium]